MKVCFRCRGPNSTMSGLCVACLIWVATDNALRSHECAERLRRKGATEIRPGVSRDPRSIPLLDAAAKIAEGAP